MTDPENFTTTFGDSFNEPRTKVETLSADNLTAWLELEVLKTGTDNQRERHLAGVLPEDELTTLARVTLFAPFAAVAELRRWAGRDREALGRELKHKVFPGVLGEPVCQGITLETAEIGELTASEWTMLKTLKRLAGIVSTHPWITRGHGKVEVVAVTHWATCAVCEAEICRSSAKVSISWAGRTLVREWAL